MIPSTLIGLRCGDCSWPSVVLHAFAGRRRRWRYLVCLHCAARADLPLVAPVAPVVDRKLADGTSWVWPAARPDAR